jgi:hypothetical protein
MMNVFESFNDYIPILFFVEQFQISKNASGKYELNTIKSGGKDRLIFKILQW